MSNIIGFLINLACDPTMQELFQSQPKAMMKAAGLTETEISRLTSRDRTKISAALDDSLATNEFVAIQASCTVLDPGPDPDPDPDPDPPPVREPDADPAPGL